MKKIILSTLLALATGLGGSARAEGTHVMDCRAMVGSRIQGTLYTAEITSEDGKLTLAVERCTGTLNWGCGNGMANLVDNVYRVSGNSQSDYWGQGASLSRKQNGGYLLVVSEFTYQFAPQDCSQ